jgi:hypothetical protein
VLGWKYVHAEEETQKYKIGKFILETKRVVRGVGWDADGDGDQGDIADATLRVEEEEVEFDSQDEDECEDLFSGIWTEKLARRRRAQRVGAARRS